MAAKNLQNPDPLVYNNVADTYQTTFPNQDIRRPNAIKVNRLVGNSLYIDGDVEILGFVKTPLYLRDSLIIPDGNVNAPAIRFLNDLDTGIYRSGDGSITLVSNGLPALETTPISITVSKPIATSFGNLVLNPAGGAVDFSGAALINYAGISGNPNYFSVTSTSNIDSAGATPITLLTVSTDTDCVYTLEATASCLSLFDNVSAGSFIKSARAQNIGGVVTVSGFIENGRSRDAPIASADITFGVSGTSILLIANGVGGHNIRWFSGMQITRMKKV